MLIPIEPTSLARAFRVVPEVPIRIVGACMGPALPHGSRVSVTAPSGLLPGDVVAFIREDGVLAIHRFLAWLPGDRGWRALTQADASATPDRPVPAGKIIGRVRGVAPRRLLALARLARHGLARLGQVIRA